VHRIDEIRARREEIYAIARKHKAEKLWVFGSCARREERPDSDVDILVEFKKGSSLVDHVYIHDALVGLLGGKVDVVSSRGLHPYIGKQVWKDAVSL